MKQEGLEYFGLRCRRELQSKGGEASSLHSKIFFPKLVFGLALALFPAGLTEYFFPTAIFFIICGCPTSDIFIDGKRIDGAPKRNGDTYHGINIKLVLHPRAAPHKLFGDHNKVFSAFKGERAGNRVIVVGIIANWNLYRNSRYLPVGILNKPPPCPRIACQIGLSRKAPNDHIGNLSALPLNKFFVRKPVVFHTEIACSYKKTFFAVVVISGNQAGIQLADRIMVDNDRK